MYANGNGNGSGNGRKHVVLFPFMGHGHLAPFLACANLIGRRMPGYTITLVNTPRNIQTLRSSLGSSSTIRLRELPFFPGDHGLPSDTENMGDLPTTLFINFFQASESLHSAFDRLLSDITLEDGTPPLCVIADFFLAWTVDVARSHGVFHSVLITGGAYGFAVYFSIWRHLAHAATAANEYFSLPDLPQIRLRKSELTPVIRNADGCDAWSGFFRRQVTFMLESDAFLVNSVEEFEKAGVDMLWRTFAVPVRCIGPLLTHPMTPSSIINCSSNSCIIEWLDSHPPASVLYVSFGSQNTIGESQMMELAIGLEASGQRFIWVVRPPLGFDIKGGFRPEWLPEGFEERMQEKKQGLVVQGWAPQLDILSHRSTGAFLSHCGWNSLLESLSCGVPIIGWPLGAEQYYNSMMLAEEMGVSVELGKGHSELLAVDRTDVERAIRLVMAEEGAGKEMRRKAGEISELLARALEEKDEFAGGSSLRGLSDFFQAAMTSKVSDAATLNDIVKPQLSVDTTMFHCSSSLDVMTM